MHTAIPPLACGYRKILWQIVIAAMACLSLYAVLDVKQAKAQEQEEQIQENSKDAPTKKTPPYTTAEQVDDWEQRRANALEQRQRARQMRLEIEEAYLSKKKTCYERILVNYCLYKAHLKKVDATNKANQIDIDARVDTRKTHKEEFEAKEHYRLKELEVIEKEEAADFVEDAAEKARLQGEANFRRTRQQEKARLGKIRKDEEDAKRARDIAAHEKKVADQIKNTPK